MNATKNLSLWQLTTEHKKLLSELYDYETGEVNELVQARLNALEPTIEKKCISVTSWIRKLESEAHELDILMEEIKLRKMSYKKEVEKYQRYLIINMEKEGISKISCPYFTVKLKKNQPSTDIINEDLIPDKFMREREIVKVEVKPDKNAIKEEVLRSGKQVPGAYVGHKTKLEIKIDKL